MELKGDDKMKLTVNEIAVLEVMWKAERPLTGKEIIEHSVDKSWKDSSIHILINSLLNKGAIRESGFVRTGKGYGRTFEPSESGEVYYAEVLASIVEKTSVITLFSALFSHGKITKDTIQELEDLLAKKKQEL